MPLNGNRKNIYMCLKTSSDFYGYEKLYELEIQMFFVSLFLIAQFE